MRLTLDFLAPYLAKRDSFSSLLARSVYTSKYRRGQETWAETVRRCVEGNVAHDPSVSEDEARKLYHAMFTMQFLPPGRGLWTGGVPGVPVEALYNCFYSTIRTAEDWCWGADMLMCGGGVGFGLYDVDALPVVERGSDLLHLACVASHPDHDAVAPDVTGRLPGALFVVDSREGWVDALRQMFRAAWAGHDFVADLSQIRPRGAPIVRFGGIAPGPAPLARLLRSVWRIIRGAAGRRMTSVECLDVTNLIGVCVKSGNVRRSAQIILGNPHDQDFRDAKKDMAAVISHRHTSNNSVVFRTHDEAQRFNYHALARDLSSNGEPGIVNLARCHPLTRGVNPCGEVELQDREACCLSEVFLSNRDGRLTDDELFRLAARYTLRQRLDPMIDAEAEEVRLRNMRIGVGLGGVCDFEWSEASLQAWRSIVREEADAYADHLGVARPIATTTVKPGGCRPWYALTATTHGLLTLEEIFGDHPVGQQWADVKSGIEAIQDNGATSRITKTYANGKAALLRIRMACGLEVESTHNHQWFVLGRHVSGKDQGRAGLHSNPRWVRADEIRVGDVIDVRLGTYDRTEHAPLRAASSMSLRMRSDAAEITQPSHMSSDLAWFIGYLWGDGAMSPMKYRIRFIDQRVENLQKAARVMREVFGLESIIKPASGARKAHAFEVGSKMLWHWLIKNGVWKYDADALDLIPRCIRASSQEDIIAFIAGLIDSDGWAGAKNKANESSAYSFVIASADKRFARHVQDVAWAVGLGLYNSHNSRGANHQTRKSIYLVGSTNFIDGRAFAMLAKHSTKIAPLSDLSRWGFSSGTPRRVMGKVESLSDAGECETYDVEVEGTHWYRAGAVKSHNTVSLVAGTSPGMHAPFADYYLRRTRIADNEPMAAALREAGLPHEVDVYDKTGRTLVFEFPVRSHYRGPTVQTESTRDQFERQAALQRAWSDNAVSATIGFTPGDEAHLAELLREYVPHLKSTSCLPRDGGLYPQAPYQVIDRAEYKERFSRIRHDHPLTVEVDDALVVDECEGGSCPAR